MCRTNVLTSFVLKVLEESPGALVEDDGYEDIFVLGNNM